MAENGDFRITGDVSDVPPPAEETTTLTDVFEEAAKTNNGVTVEPGGAKVLAATFRHHNANIKEARAEVEKIRGLSEDERITGLCDSLLERLPADGLRMFIPPPPGTPSDPSASA